MDEEGYLTLTAKGEAEAAKVYGRHQVLTRFLGSLGVSAKTAEEDACRIEHILSEETMMEKIQRLTASYYTGHTPAQMTSRFVSDVASVSDLFTDGVVSMLVDGLKIIGVIISIGLFSRELMIVALCAVPLIGWITRVYQNNVRKAQTDNFAQLGQVNSHISETVRCFSMDVANASVYDGCEAAAEAMIMCLDPRHMRMLVSAAINPEVLKVLKTYAHSQGAELVMEGQPVPGEAAGRDSGRAEVTGH